MADFRGSARGPREVREVVENPEIFKNIPVLAPAGRPAPGPGRDLFLRLVRPVIYAQEINILGSKKPLFLGGN